MYRTLDQIANNPYLNCGNLEQIDDDLSPDKRNNKSCNLLQCGGIHRLASEDDDEIAFEINEKDYEDIELVVENSNSFYQQSVNLDSSNNRDSSKNENTTKKQRGRRKHKRYFSKRPKRNGSLYHKTMMTAATANEGGNNNEDSSQQQAGSQTPTASSSPASAALQSFRFARGFADDAGRAIGNLMPKASLQNLTARKYTLPDKTVASQVLMYRQLLHTKCRPGLKLARKYEETPAQKAVMHMPWWEEGIEESRKMTISYDNLITRLWLNGAIEPYRPDLLALDNSTETLIGEDGLPPVPHEFWIERLGFQQPDPVTDFRSGGVLSLAMMVYMVESKPDLCRRFFTGDTKVLPFGITCINVTDMIAKFLMLAKSTDRMDALLSQKPFWKMFADPNAITAVQELAMSMLCDVAVELGEEKKIPYLAEKTNTNEGMPGDASTEVSSKLLETVCLFFSVWSDSMTLQCIVPFSHPKRFSFFIFISRSPSLIFPPFWNAPKNVWNTICWERVPKR